MISATISMIADNKMYVFDIQYYILLRYVILERSLGLTTRLIVLYLIIAKPCQGLSGGRKSPTPGLATWNLLIICIN